MEIQNRTSQEGSALEAPLHDRLMSQPGNPPALAGDETVQLANLLDLLVGGRWVILVTTLLVLGVVGTYTFMVSPEYESSSILMVDTRKSGSGDLTQALTLGLGEAFGAANRTLANEVEFLRQSQVIAERTADRLFETRFVPGTDELLSILDTEEEEPLTVGQVSRRLQNDYLAISPLSKDVDMIRVTATSTDPVEAALIANLYTQEYLTRAQEASRARVSASREFIASQEQKQREQLRSLEDQIQAYMTNNSAVALDEEATHVVSQIADLEALRDQARIEKEMTQATLRTMEAELAAIEPNLARRVASGVEREISASQAKIADLELVVEQIYLRNPALRGNEAGNQELLSLTRQVDGLKKRVEELSEQYVEEVMAVGGVDPAVQARDISGTGLAFISQAARLQRQIAEERIRFNGLQAKENVLTSRLAEYEGKLRELPAQTIQLAQLQRSQQATEKLYLFLVEKLQEASVAEQSEIGYAEVIRDALVPEFPVRPRKAMNLALGLMLGLMMGVGLAMLRRQLDNHLRIPEDVRKLGQNVLGVIPTMAGIIKDDFGGKETVEVHGRHIRTTLITALNPLAPISEAYRRLRTNIQFSRADTLVQMILVTSAAPGEGKSSTAMNLAITMAQAGRRTLYIDADLRRPTGHKMFDQLKEPGLSQVLFGLQEFDPKVFTSPVDDLHVLPAGASVPNPSELLGSQKMRDFLRRMREQFDVIVLDTPPVLAVTDAVLLSTQTDATILVVSAGSTPKGSLYHAIEALQSVGAPLIGAVLNRFDQDATHRYYGYTYGYRYGQYTYDYAAGTGKKKERGIIRRFFAGAK